jgi:hypothetical protein
MKIHHVGYVRKSRNGRALKLDIAVQNVLDAVRYTGKNGQEYVGLVINMSTLLDVLEDRRIVTGVNQISVEKDKGSEGRSDKGKKSKKGKTKYENKEKRKEGQVEG